MLIVFKPNNQFIKQFIHLHRLKTKFNKFT